MRTFADICCGIGGFRLALEKEGLKCVFSCDSDPRARQTYSDNFGEMPFGDIFDIGIKDIPDFDLLCAGFPCESFSQAGKIKGLQDTNPIERIVEIASEKQPEAMILENVPFIKHTNGGKDIERIADSIRDAGFDLFTDTINSGEFGLPQQRKRIYFIALRNDLDLSYATPKTTNEPCSLNDVLVDDSEITHECSTRDPDRIVWRRNDSLLFDEPNQTILLGSYGKEHAQGMTIYSPRGHAITQTASNGYGSGHYLVNGKIRRLHLTEVKRVMGFPDDFIVPTTKKGRDQLGRAVVPKIVSAIYNQICEI